MPQAHSIARNTSFILDHLMVMHDITITTVRTSCMFYCYPSLYFMHDIHGRLLIRHCHHNEQHDADTLVLVVYHSELKNTKNACIFCAF